MKNAQHIRYFLFSQSLSDGVRITLEIILPALAASYFGRLDIGLLLSTGALCVSMADAPGPEEHKKNGMLWCNILVFLMALLTGLLNHNPVSLGALIMLASFFFTMLSVFGLRASSIGLAALLVMILRMDKQVPFAIVFQESLLILAGGAWYMAVSLLFLLVRPFRQAQRSLGNCIHETAKLLLIKASLYEPDTPIDAEYQRMLSQQVIVNDSQDEVRQLLFKGKKIVKDVTRTGQVIMITFTDVVDLYEQITATWYDYSMLRNRFAHTGVLPEIASLIREMAHELDRIGLSIQSNIAYRKQFDLFPALAALKEKIDAAKIENESNLVLKKILINFRNLGERIRVISNYFGDEIDLKSRNANRIDHSKFVSHQEISFAIFRDNLSLDAAVFRHSLRMMITCVLGFMIVKFIAYGHHSYWILLTIVFILKPGYSITKQRNLQRIGGTIAGGVIGIVLIGTISDRNVLLLLMVFLMIATYTLQRLNYILMVIFMTPYILILFSYLGLGYLNIVEERVLDTAIASLLAFFASYFLFPHWESKQLDAYIVSLLKANLSYLKKLECYLSGAPPSVLEYKLIRKELYVSTANLSAALGRMLSEPKSKQENAPEINELVVLNNILSSNIASLFTIGVRNEHQPFTRDIIQPIHRSVAILEETLPLMDKDYRLTPTEAAGITAAAAGRYPDPQIKDHVDFIYKIAVDIRKVVQKIGPGKTPSFMGPR